MRMHADSWVVPCMWQRGGAYGPWPHTAHMDTCWHALRANVVPRALWHHMGPTWCHGLCDTNGAPCGATGRVAPHWGPHVVPQAVWHHIGAPIWCHGLRGTTWGPCGATGHVAPPGAHVVPQAFYNVFLYFYMQIG